MILRYFRLYYSIAGLNLAGPDWLRPGLRMTATDAVNLQYTVLVGIGLLLFERGEAEGFVNREKRKNRSAMTESWQT